MTPAVDDARRWLQNKAGWHEAERRIKAEARQLHVAPTSETAVRHAVTTYEQETGHRYPRYLSTHRGGQQPAEQGELL